MKLEIKAVHVKGLANVAPPSKYRIFYRLTNIYVGKAAYQAMKRFELRWLQLRPSQVMHEVPASPT